MKTILVIEDDRLVRSNIKTLLEEEGFKVFTTADGEEGLSLTKEIQPDLIICDVMMEGMNGYEVLKKLSEEPETSVIPFIFLTARVEKEDMRMGMELGADDYIFKPFEADTLLRAIQIRLNKYERLKAEFVDKNGNEVPEEKEEILPAKISYDDKILLKVNNQMLFIKTGDIKFITAENQYSSVFVTGGKSYLLRTSMSSWEHKLPEANFLRIHRSTIINVNYIEKIEKWFNNSFRLHIADIKEPFIVSRKYASKLKAFQ
jgi:DNA-binding LytR/AlgR family response regulator